MFEFEVAIDCPYCGHNDFYLGIFNGYMEPITSEENCRGCDKLFYFTPTFEVEAYTMSEKEHKAYLKRKK